MRATVFAAVAFLAGCAASAAAAAPAHPCRASHLRLTATFYGVGGGQFMQTFTFTNAAATECSLAGWPSVRLRSPSGRTTMARTVRVVQGTTAGRPFRTVDLRPGGAASFDVFGPDWNAVANRACPRTHTLLVVLPGGAPMPVDAALPYCSAFYVAPLIAGARDRRAWSVVWTK